MSSVQTQAPSVSHVNSSAHNSKDFLDDSLPRQNSFGRQRGNTKGKHLTRSHAMRESTSPPRTPTPRSDNSNTTLLTPTTLVVSTQSSSEHTIGTESRVNVQQQQQQSSSPLLETPPSLIVPQHSPSHIFTTNGGSVSESQLDLEFPKLTPPKSKSPRNSNNNNNTNNSNNRDMDKSINNEHNKSSNAAAGGGNSMFINNSNTSSSSSSSDTTNQSNHTTSYCSPNNNNSHSSSGPNNNNNNVNCINTSNASSGSSPIISTSPSSQPQQHTLQINNVSSSTSSFVVADNTKDHRCSRESQNYNNYDDSQNQCESPSDGMMRNVDRSGGKKHRNGATVKGSKPRLKTMGSSSSVEGGCNTSGFISRDSSTEHFTDQNGVDLVQFFKETLNRNTKDRNTLMRIEKDLLALALDRSRTSVKFPPMSSYNRMLIHRVAAYFCMEHNVDATQQSVIAGITKSTRVPEVRFKSLIKDVLSEEPKKSILKRDAHSFDEYRQGLLGCPGMLDRKAKSFEEREEEYEKVKRRIFKGRGGDNCGGGGGGGESMDEHYWPNWSSSDSSDQSARFKNNRLMKVQSLSVDTRHDGRPCVSKAHSFGGYVPQPPPAGLTRGDSVNSTKSAGPRLFTKQDSFGSQHTPWRLSPSSSGRIRSYKTQTQSLRSDSVTPSPTGYCSGGDHTPEPTVTAQSPGAPACGVVWAVTDMASVPKGSVLIDPQTLLPIVNQDGSIYHFDPTNLPPNQAPQQSSSAGGGNVSNNNKRKNIPENYQNIPPPTLPIRNDLKPEIEVTANYIEIVDKQSAIQENEIVVLPMTGSNPEDLDEDIGEAVACDMQPADESISDFNIIQTKDENDISEEIIKDLNVLSIPQQQLHHEVCDNDDEDLEEPQQQQEEIVINETPTDCLKTDSNFPQPKHKNQATSPNIPRTPEHNHTQPLIDDQSHTTNNSATEIVSNYNNNQQLSVITNSNSSSNNHHNHNNNQQQHHHHHSNHHSTPDSIKVTTTSNKPKDDLKIVPSVINLMGYTTTSGYPSLENGAVFPNAQNSTFSTYQPGPDGSVYAVPQPMLYAYSQPMESEIPGYFLPVYDQSGSTIRSDGSHQGALIPAPAAIPTAALYQPAGSTTTAVVPVAYSSGPYSNAHLYQGQMIYAPQHAADQYGAATAANAAAAAAAATGQVHQYPQYSYPVGYSYPYNGSTYPSYWGQTMTYYVPQQLAANGSGATPTIIQPSSGATGHNVVLTHQSTQASHTGGGGGNGGKRGSPATNQHHNNQSHHHHSHSTPSTPAASTYNTITSFTPSVPIPIDQVSGSAAGMYAAIPPTVYSNLLPYPTPVSAGVYSHLPHQTNAVINSSIPPPPPPATNIQQHSSSASDSSSVMVSGVGSGGAASSTSASGTQQTFNNIYTSSSNSSSHNTSGATPQSTPSTPISIPLPLPQQHQPPHQKNPPLFSTPPLIPNNFTPQFGNYSNGGGGGSNENTYHSGNSSVSGSTSGLQHDTRKSIPPNGGGGPPRKTFFNNTYIASNRPNSFIPQNNGPRKSTPTDSSSNGSGSQTTSYNRTINNMSLPKRIPNNNTNIKLQSQQSLPHHLQQQQQHPMHQHQPALISTVPQQHQQTINNTMNNSGNNGGGGIIVPPPNIPGGMDKIRGPRPKPANLDLRRSNNSNRNTPSTNSTESNNSPNSIASCEHPPIYMTTRGTTHIPPMHHHHHHQQQQQHQPQHQQHQTHSTTTIEPACHPTYFGTYNGAPGMYVKMGQTYFTHQSLTFPNSRKTPPTDIRPQMTPLTGMYPAMNMMLTTPRAMGPRPSSHPNPNYKGNRPR